MYMPKFAHVVSCSRLQLLTSPPLAARHHVDFLYLRAGGILSQNVTRHQEFRDYVRGYEPRASFAHPTTVRRLAECVWELQREERMQRIARRKLQFRNGMCVGVQLDMWTDTDTHTPLRASP